MTHDEMIAVIQAHKDGKKIQFRLLDAGGRERLPGWNDCVGGSPHWDFPHVEYRIKPEPREFWLRIGWTGKTAFIASDLQYARDNGYVHVREVLD